MVHNKKLGWGFVVLGVVLLLLLTVIKLQFDEQSAFLCQVVSDDPTLSMDSCPAHQNNISWVILLGFGLSFVGIGVGLFVALSGKKSVENNPENKEIKLEELDSDEKRIILILKEKKGSVYQSELIKETELSKVKMTRILDKLEGRGLLHRKRRGMTNIVLLK